MAARWLKRFGVGRARSTATLTSPNVVVCRKRASGKPGRLGVPIVTLAIVHLKNKWDGWNPSYATYLWMAAAEPLGRANKTCFEKTLASPEHHQKLTQAIEHR